MRKLSSNEWIAVGAAVIIVILLIVLPGALSKNDQVQDANTAAQPVETATTTAMDNNATQVQIVDEKVGTGAAVKSGDTVSVLYTGMFTNGKVFDASSMHGGTPLQFQVGSGVIPGFTMGVTGMQVGGKRKVTIPPSLGYGPNDYGPIPGNSTLIFEMELVGIK